MRVTKILTFVLLAATFAGAQASRTWVSGTGDDANPCSRTAPCKTFAGAISKTAAGGEIDALDPGGFGAVTITKGMTIDGGGGQVASVLVSGTNGIVVQAGPSDVVILRNLRINGFGSGLNGVRFLSGKDLNLENCYIFGFTQNGIDIALSASASAHVLNTVVKNNGGVGIRATTTVGQVQVGIDHSWVLVDNVGVEAADHSRVVINRSFIQHAASNGVQADSSSGDSVMTIDHTDISYNSNGTLAGPGGANIFLADNKIAFNSNVGANVTGGVNFTYGTNRLHNNGFGSGSLTPAVPGQQ